MLGKSRASEGRMKLNGNLFKRLQHQCRWDGSIGKSTDIAYLVSLDFESRGKGRTEKFGGESEQDG